MPEQVKLALEAIGLEEQGAAVGLGDGVLREERASDRPFDPSTGLGQPTRQPVGLPQAERERGRGSRSSGRAGEETGFPWKTTRRKGVTRKRGEAKVGGRHHGPRRELYRDG